MNNRAIKLVELNNKLNTIPRKKLDLLIDFVDFLLKKSSNPAKEKVGSLKDVWSHLSNKDVKKIEDGIMELRKDSSEQILRKFNK